MDETTSKKRGRKPKGGKITTAAKINKQSPQTSLSSSSSSLSSSSTTSSKQSLLIQKDVKPNVILHLKCCKNDLKKEMDTVAGYGHGESHFLNYNTLDEESTNSIFDKFMTLNNNKTSINVIDDVKDEEDDDNDVEEVEEDFKNVILSKSVNKKLTKKEMKDINLKLKNLDYNLHVNHVMNNKSACFWCTCDFNNTPVFLPKGYVKDTLQVYGCFCSPQCAVGFLMKENLDSSTRFERYSLLHHIYSSEYEYETTIKPAPCPYYTLKKYLGNLTIEEYRNLSSKTIMLKIDKPITRILPEFHQDNDDYILTSKLISSNTNTNTNSMNNPHNTNNPSSMNSSLKKNKISLLFTK